LAGPQAPTSGAMARKSAMAARVARWSSVIESRTLPPLRLPAKPLKVCQLALFRVEAAPIPHTFAMFYPLPAKQSA
jgi:hypothetical protein